MSKAFTRESDSEEDEVGLPPLPAGGKNYITPQGYAALRAELFELIAGQVRCGHRKKTGAGEYYRG